MQLFPRERGEGQGEGQAASILFSFRPTHRCIRGHHEKSISSAVAAPGGERAPARNKGCVRLHRDRAEGRAHWTGRSYAALAREGFMRNPVAHRAVRLISEAAAACRCWSMRATANAANIRLLAAAAAERADGGGRFSRGALRASAALGQCLCRAVDGRRGGARTASAAAGPDAASSRAATAGRRLMNTGSATSVRRLAAGRGRACCICSCSIRSTIT